MAGADDDEVEIYIRPVMAAPAGTILPTWIRIKYGRHWVDFKDGDVIISEQ